nr:hypothetical protein [Tanacetum cinerariifolium]
NHLARLDHSRRLRALELDCCHVMRANRNREMCQLGFGQQHMGRLGEVIGTVPVDAGAQESCLGEMA